jgi:hypothetical protein
MTIQIELPAELEARLEAAAAQQGKDARDYVRDLVKRDLVLRELEALRIQPRIPPPPGKSWLEAVVGQWPGDESDEEIERTLRDELTRDWIDPEQHR